MGKRPIPRIKWKVMKLKYAMTWTPRQGASGADNEISARRALELFSKWQPDPGTTILQFVGYVDSEGGVAIIETDNVEEVMAATAKFAPYNRFEVRPVLDVADWVRIAQEGISYRNGIS